MRSHTVPRSAMPRVMPTAYNNLDERIGRTLPRRMCLAYCAFYGFLSTSTSVLSSTKSAPAAAAVAHQERLDTQQSLAFRAWFCAIVEDQVLRAPSPRWVHRDCAGLVRFAVRQALQNHDAKWLRAMGWPSNRPHPRDVDITAQQQKKLSQWMLQDGTRSDYASALSLVQNNTQTLSSKNIQPQSADLLFFDQGSEQHVMVWTGKRIAYHTGSPETLEDNGLRATTLQALLAHPDTRWRPSRGNPNFAGWYRFNFLTL